MKAFVKILLLVAACCQAQYTQAQYQGRVFQYNTRYKVYDAKGEQGMAWAGGMNVPQFAMADLNKDGLLDMVVLEPYISFKTYINHGTKGNPDYRYEPKYEHNFPPMDEYVKLVDYNRDGVMDLVKRGGLGFELFRGSYNNNELTFQYYKGLFYKLGSGQANAYCVASDIPAVKDIDGDGDLDFLAYNDAGKYITLYKNCQVEQGLPKDSVRICLADNCWGKVYQGIVRTQDLGSTCDQSFTTGCKGCPSPGAGNKTTHVGNTLCILDMDGDGDLDYFNGGVSYNDVQFLRNGKADFNYPIDTMIAQDTSWGVGGHKVGMATFPAAFNLDIDCDGDSDLLFTPHADGTENYKSVAFYENVGSVANPSFVYRSDSFLIDRMIDAGSNTYPFFYDYDKDGKKDLFVGSSGYYKSTDGSRRSRIMYYKNTSTGTTPIFTLQTKDFMSLGDKSYQGASIAIGDIDGDSKDDLLLGHTDGTISYYKNGATSNTVQPVWALEQDSLKNDAGVAISTTAYATPFVYDMDKDGKQDLVIGSQPGWLFFYKGQSSTGNVSLKYVTNKLGNVKVSSPNVSDYSTVYIGKMDNTEVEYLVVGSQTGILQRFDGFQSGNITGNYTRIDTFYSEITTELRSAPNFADLDGDGKYEMVSGNSLGGVLFYQQLFNLDVNDVVSNGQSLKIYPNPATDNLSVAWPAAFAGSGSVQVSLISLTGQKLISVTVDGSANAVQLPLGDIAAGMYYCIVQSGSTKAAQTVAVIK